MTSLAFMFGVLPLALSTGAGANSRIAIGTSVIGGMLTATMLAVFYIPLFFVIVRRTTRDTLKKLHLDEHPPAATEGGAHESGALIALALLSGCSMAPNMCSQPCPCRHHGRWAMPILRQTEAALPVLSYREVFVDPGWRR